MVAHDVVQALQDPPAAGLKVLPVQATQTGLLVPPHVPDSCCPAAHELRQVAQVRSVVAVAATDWYWPVLQEPDTAVQVVSCVALHAADWYEPEEQVEQATHWPDAVLANCPVGHTLTQLPLVRINSGAWQRTHWPTLGPVQVVHEVAHERHARLASA